MDPEKELMKRKPLQEIVFEKHEAVRDQRGGRKRKLPSKVSQNYTSRTTGEPAIDSEQIKDLCSDLADSKCPKVLTRVLKLNHTQNKENATDTNAFVQRSSTWFNARIGKITSSKASAAIGLLGRREFEETWHCIKAKKQEPQKYFVNFERGILFEDEAATFFEKESGAVLKECGLYPLKDDENYAASPDRIFDGKMCKRIFERKTEKEITLPDFCLLEIETRAKGNSDPLAAVTVCHVTQTKLQMKYTEATVCILQSYVPETKTA